MIDTGNSRDRGKLEGVSTARLQQNRDLEAFPILDAFEIPPNVPQRVKSSTRYFRFRFRASSYYRPSNATKLVDVPSSYGRNDMGRKTKPKRNVCRRYTLTNVFSQ